MEKRQQIMEDCICVSLSSEQALLISNLISKYCFNYPGLDIDFGFSCFETRAAIDFAEYIYSNYSSVNKKNTTSTTWSYASINDKNELCLNRTLYLWILLLFKRCLEKSRNNNHSELSNLVADIESIKKLYKYIQSYYRSLTGVEYREDLIEEWRAAFGNNSPFQCTEDVVYTNCKTNDDISTQKRRYFNDFTSPIPDGTADGDVLTLPINNDLISFRWCPPGTFLMGSGVEEQKQFGVYYADDIDSENEELSHVVTLTHGFWMMQYPVTRHWYLLFVGESNKNENIIYNNAFPINNVSWHDCIHFTDILNERTNVLSCGYRFSLPTESQWEYACRAGTATAFAGTQNIETMGWYELNSKDRLHPVGCKQPNNWGLYDMHGNIIEWCLDEYNSYPGQTVIDPCGTSPIFSEKIINDFYIKENVCRGGSWFSPKERCRSAARSSAEPSERSDLIGFRLILQALTDG